MNDEVMDAPAAESALAEYTPTARALADLRARYSGVVFDLTTTKGNKAAREARRELVTLRTTLEARRKELKAPALERSRLIDAEAKRITLQIEALEDPITDQIAADERRRAAETAAKAKIEQERIDGHMARLAAVRAAPSHHARSDAATLAAAIDEWRGEAMNANVWQEFLGHAERARDETITALCALRAEAEAREAEAARMAEQRAALEAQAAELAAQRAEHERLAAEAAARQAEADRQAQAARDEADRLAAEARAAEQAKLDVERAELAQARAAIEQATQPGAWTPVAQGGVAGNPVQPQPVAKPPAGDAAVDAGAVAEGVAAPSSNATAAADVTALPAEYAPSIEALQWLPLSQPPSDSEVYVLIWRVSTIDADPWGDWIPGIYDNGFHYDKNTFIDTGGWELTHYAIVRGPFNA